MVICNLAIVSTHGKIKNGRSLAYSFRLAFCLMKTHKNPRPFFIFHPPFGFFAGEK
jgi:hypothetical protein